MVAREQFAVRSYAVSSCLCKTTRGLILQWFVSIGTNHGDVIFPIHFEMNACARLREHNLPPGAFPVLCRNSIVPSHAILHMNGGIYPINIHTSSPPPVPAPGLDATLLWSGVLNKGVSHLGGIWIDVDWLVAS
jgi:hypothetical protein